MAEARSAADLRIWCEARTQIGSVGDFHPHCGSYGEPERLAKPDKIYMYTSRKAHSRRHGQTRSPVAAVSHSRAFLALSALLILIFATGGASRADVASLPVLRPAATAFLFLGLYWLKAKHVSRQRFLLVWAAAIALLALCQLIPLPPQVWQSLPGRGLIAEIDQTVGLGEIWRPLTMTPAATRNAFWSLMPPLACLVLAVQLDATEHKKVLNLVLLLGLTSAAMGMLQLLGDPNGPLYFYKVTGNGQAVGLYANRNHQALLLATLLPILAVWALLRTDDNHVARLRAVLATGASAFIVPLLLITGSRAGLILGLTALVLSGAILAAGLRGSAKRNASSNPSSGSARAKRKVAQIGFPALTLLLLGGVAVLVSASVVLNRDLAIERLLERDIAEDARAKTMPTILEITQQHIVFGSGLGSFEQVYQIHEPDALLGPTYMNHAHNDWVELLQTGGIPALILLLAGIAWAACRTGKYSWSNAIPGDSRRLGQAGACFLILAGMGSIGDYPLRTPSLASLTVIALVWIGMMTPVRAESRPV